MNVALDFSGREWTVAEPLAAAGITVVKDRQDADAVVTDTAAALPAFGRDRPWLYRPRGNYWTLDEVGALRRRVHGLTRLAWYDSIVAPGPHVAGYARRHTRQRRVATVGLPIDADDWPTVEHTDAELRCLTLTNFDYRRKVAPLVEYAPVVASVLEETGGRWFIAGDGEHREWVREQVRQYDGVSVVDYVDAKDACRRANVMLHLSGQDIARPNAMLEGMASNLPVVVNGFEGFERVGEVLRAGDAGELAEMLLLLANPDARERTAAVGREYVRERHAPERIGERWRAVLQGAVA